MVEKIPGTFQSAEHYFASFVYPLLEETRAQLSLGLELISRAPFAEVICIDKVEPDEELLYNVRVDYWRNRSAGRCLDPYRTVPGDLVIFADAKLETFSDVQSLRRKTRAFALVTEVRENEIEDDGTTGCFKSRVSKERTEGDGKNKWTFMYFLINITTGERIWNALHMSGNLNIIKQVLFTDSMVKESCELCPESSSGVCTENFGTILSSKLNKSQMAAVLASLRKIHCNHKTLTCAPTAVAVKEVASRVMKHLKESFETDPQKDASICSLGDLLFFGNHDFTGVGSEMKEIYLDHRVERLAKCFEPLNGWRHSFNSMIVFLEGGVSEDHVSEDELSKMEEGSIEGSKGKRRTYLQLAREQFKSTSLHLREVVITLSTHIPKSFIMEHNFQAMLSLLGFLHSFESLLHQDNMVSEELENLFAGKENVKHSSKSVADSSTLMEIRSECLHILKNLRNSLDELQFPKNIRKDLLIDFCFQTASSIFSTAADSHKLYLVDMKPLNILVIDEAAQLRECESTIPLQLPGIKLAILIGEKFQLPSRVTSNICDKAGFGRSLYERLSSLDHAKHFLNLQYRMHPSISLFPCSNFYANQILDAPNVKHKAYEKKYLPDPDFRPYLFINISCGREEVDEFGHSVKNMVEVAVLMKIVQNLYQDWRSGIKEELRIGVLSTYTAQVLEIQERLKQKYENNDRFSVKVQTIDGFQGGEEDIILISTVRANNFGSVGVMADVKITNVALTRARHGLWILGSERTLVMSETVWKDIVHDAKDRHCLLNADEDCDLSNTIFKVKAELYELDDLLNRDSSLFNSTRWKLTPFDKILSFVFLSPSIPRWYLYIVCSNDLEKECGYYTQVLKVWDILALEDIPKLVKHLDRLFEMYTDDYLTRCKKKCWEGELEIPMSWTTSYDIVQYKSLSNNATGRISNVSGLARRGGFENSIVSESFLIMKFYSVTFNMVRHFISSHDGRELDLPFELTDQERETIFFNRSSFILGRSGTGKTTVLSMKLFQKEQLFHIASEGLYEVEAIRLRMLVREMKLVNALEMQRSMLAPTFCYMGNSYFSRFPDAHKPSRTVTLKPLSDQEREQRDRVYDIFLEYEKKKFKKGEYDLSDLVMDLHFRLRSERYEGDHIDFVYIDEVQDLTMRQIALFKFQDIRHLFFKEFVLGSRTDATDEKKEKGKLSKIFHLSQNFRTHAGVLNLAQSIIDLLYHFFPLTIDVLNPETSLINGEAPVLIECGNFRDALPTIFGDSENAQENVGFGAEQVILVRNDSAKEEISKYVGKKALVLTILECKGLEFGFDEAKHNVLCSELKQLYVAITRTRQRLWICDIIDEVSKPMLEYWEKLSLIQVRCLHDLVAQGMQVASRPDEWRSQGFKLFHEHNYEMARLCFEKAGDMYNEKFARAASLQALANSISSSSPQMAKNYLSEAADMFEGIGKAEYAAKCFFEMRSYERAGISCSIKL
ncbi:Helicase SEN1 [Vitis vinifera]|uniref:Helicase SEN1 n=1 Tax=Vitis vinifera TaxID=29760 RepID=A0A438EJJ3_VITVI|nr:Helicase SEN1 [Vitis vinifera]